MRIANTTRETKETKISVELNLDGSSNYEISTGIKFFDHMLEQFAQHGSFDLKINAKSQDGDPHHLVEDIGIALGSAFCKALGDKRGINRYASVILPMDEALVLCAVDISGRAYVNIDIDIEEAKTSDFETVLLAHFFESFTHNALITLHIKKAYGIDPHHIIEATFKASARALREAVSINSNNKNTIPSTKGIL